MGGREPDLLKNCVWMVSQLRGRTDLAFAWLDQYQPAGSVGKSILLYYVPEGSANRVQHNK